MTARKRPGPTPKYRYNPTFTQFLKTQVNRQDRVGDFARDWVSDKNTSRGITGEKFGKPRGALPRFSPVRHYLERSAACEDAIDAAQAAFTEWKKLGRLASKEPALNPTHKS